MLTACDTNFNVSVIARMASADAQSSADELDRPEPAARGGMYQKLCNWMQRALTPCVTASSSP